MPLARLICGAPRCNAQATCTQASSATQRFNCIRKKGSARAARLPGCEPVGGLWPIDAHGVSPRRRFALFDESWGGPCLACSCLLALRALQARLQAALRHLCRWTRGPRPALPSVHASSTRSNLLKRVLFRVLDLYPKSVILVLPKCELSRHTCTKVPHAICPR